MGKDLKGKELGKGFSQRPDGRYEARAKINGVKIDIYDMSLPNLKKAFELEKARVLRDEKGIRPNLKLKEWYNEWFEKCKSPQLKSDVSRKTYDRKLRNTFIRILGDKRIEEVTQMNIQDAATQLYEVEHYNARSIKEALSVLRECLDIAIVNKILSVNPCRGVTVHEGNEMAKERRVLNHWEQDAFLEEVNDSYYNEPYRILLVTGMRIGEFSGLQWDDVDFEKKVIHIRRSMMTAYQDGKKIMELTTPKTVNSYRSIPFFDDTENLFKEWKKKQDLYRQKLGNRWRSDEKFGDLVFTTTMGSPITRYNIVHDLKKVETNIILKENNRAYREGRKPREFGHLHPHCFRHTFATRCFEKGLDPVVVQSIMGHANYSTTLSYTHILEDKTKEEVAKVGKFL